MSAVPHLQKQLKELTQHPVAGFRCEVESDLFTWTVWFSGPKDTPYFPGQYRAQMTFPQEFPFKPPEMRILSSIWHPNIYPDGKVCISILHPPGTDDMNSLESASMRWTPVQSIEKVLVSVISLFADPDAADAGAPANVDALVEYRKNKQKFIQRCQELAQKSLKELPDDFVAPPENDAAPPLQQKTSSLYMADSNLWDEESGDDEAGDNNGKGDANSGGGGGGGRPHKYTDELSQIRSMGMGAEMPDEKLLEKLEKYKGDVSRVIEDLY